MDWTPGGRSNDVEDRRGQPAPGGRGIPLGILSLIGSRFGIGGVILAVLGYAAFQFIGSRVTDPQPVATAQNDRPSQFVSFVLDDVQKTWEAKLPSYKHAKLVLFTGATETGCGYGDRAVGPFYCPRDEKVYLDLSFFQTLSNLGGKGEFAQAYVIAHEIGHHVQNLKGLKMEGVRPGAAGTSVKVELQADCYAGVWAHSTAQRQLLEKGDLESALNAASSIGDDKLQRKEQGFVRPETFTHGSSAQRAMWFKRGYDSGDPASCNTFET